MILMDAPEPDLRLSLRFVVPLVLGFVVIAGFLGRLALVAQRQRPATGVTVLLGTAGEALTPIAPGGAGQVRVRGEIWRAIADDSIAQGTRVVVTNLDGLTLTVRQA
jgi:membrane-bound serine protease (ClpP class)